MRQYWVESHPKPKSTFFGGNNKGDHKLWEAFFIFTMLIISHSKLDSYIYHVTCKG